jgi:hypothetical protein
MIIDGVLTNCVRFSAYLKQLLSDPVSGQSVPVFVRDHDGDGGVVVDDIGHWLGLASSYSSCHTAVRSENEKRILAKFISRYANPAMGRLFQERCFSWRSGYDLDIVDKVVKGLPSDGDKPVLFCGGNFDSQKVKREELKIAQWLFAINAVEVMVTSRSSRYKIENVLPSGDSSFVRWINARASSAVYLKDVGRAHLFVSVQEGYDSLANEEEFSRLLMGQIGIFPHLNWVTERLGSKYPFYYNFGNADEALAMAEWVATHYTEALGSVVSFVSRLRSEHDQESTLMMAWREMAERIQDCYVVHKMKERKDGKQPLFSVIHHIAEKLGDSFALDVFLDILEEHVPWLKPWNRKGALKELGEVPRVLPTLYDIREMLDNLGWVDTCEGPSIMLRRESTTSRAEACSLERV